MWNENQDGFCYNLLQTTAKAALIALLNLSITDWSLTKNKAYEQILMLQVDSESSCKQQVLQTVWINSFPQFPRQSESTVFPSFFMFSTK